MSMTNLEKANSVRDGIRAKLDAARADLETLDSRRKALAYDAAAEGGPAKKELDGLNKLRMLAAAEIESLEHFHEWWRYPEFAM